MTEGPADASQLSTSQLRAATIAGARWVSFARVGAEISLLVSSVFLARAIPPAEFGHAAVAIVLITLSVALFSDGFTAALVQMRDVPRSQLEGTAALALTAGATLSALAYFVLPAVARPLFGERTTYLLTLGASAFLLAAWGAVPTAVLNRKLNFRATSLIELMSVAIGTATAVVLALFADLDGEALVVGALVTVALSSLAVYWLEPIGPRFVRGTFSAIVRFTSRSSVASLAFSLSRNIDYAILAARGSPAQVGFYWRAYTMGVDWQSKVSGVLVRVAFPVYSRASTLEDRRRIRTRTVRVHATLLYPLLTGFIIVAPTLIPALYGERWREAVVPAQILAAGGFAATLLVGTGPLLLAAGRAGVLLVWNVANLVLYASVVFLLAPHGVKAVSVGVSIFLFATLVANNVLVRMLFGADFSSLASEVGPAVASSVPLAALAFASYTGLRAIDAGSLLCIVLPCGIGAIAYLLTLKTVFPGAWNDTLLLARGFRSSRNEAPRRVPSESDDAIAKGGPHLVNAEGVLGAPARDG